MPELFSFESDALPPQTRVLAFSGDEGLSHLYTWDVFVLIHGEGATTLDLEALLATRATVRVVNEFGLPRMSFHGVVASAELVHDRGGEGFYKLRLMPRLWHLTLNQHSRVFADKAQYRSIVDVIKKVFTLNRLREGADYELRLSRSYKAYEHITQYKESDFSFLSRWMEREGIYYYFDHDGDQEKLVLIDDAQAHGTLAEGAKRYFPTVGHETSAVEAFQTFTAKSATLPKKVVLRDYDYLRPGTEVTATAAVSDTVQEEVVRYGDNYDQAHVRDLSTVRSQALAAQGNVYRGRGRVFDLRTGYRFEVSEHTRPELNRLYLVTRLRHRGLNVAAADRETMQRIGVDFETPYSIEVTAIGHDVQYRAPELTPMPRIWGVESATVDGAAESPYAQIDAHGRYKIRVRFDELRHTDSNNSLYIRMLQPHGGSTEGFHFPLRKGTEVMLAFVGGDPDIPVIASVAPNAERPSPVAEHNHTLNVIQTGSENRLEIDDAQGAQYIDWSTPHQGTKFHLGSKTHFAFNVFLQTGGDGGFDFGTDWDIKVGGWKHEDVVGEVRLTYHNIQHTTVDGRVTEIYKVGQETTINAGGKQTTVTGLVEETYNTGQTTTITSVGQTTTVTGPVTETYNTGQTTTVTAAGQTTTVTGLATHTYNTGQTVKVTGDLNETITAQYVLTVGGNKVSAVTGEESYFKGAERKFVYGLGSEIFVGAKFDVKLAATIDLQFPFALSATAGTKVELRQGVNISAHVGLSVSLKEAVAVDMEGISLRQLGPRIQQAAVFCGMSPITIFL